MRRALLVAVVLIPILGAAPAGSATPVSGPLSVRGATIRDGAGHVVLLQGIARPGMDYGTKTYTPLFNSNGCASAHVQCDPVTSADIAFIAAWHGNVVRIPLNEDMWNQTCPSPHYPGMQGYDRGYRRQVSEIVDWVTSRHLVALLTLIATQRTTCDQIGNNDIPPYPAPYPVSRIPAPDASGALVFWTSVARTFAGNDLVAFEPYNEPHVCAGRTASDPGVGPIDGGCPYRDAAAKVRTARLWRDGGSVSFQGVTYRTVGMKAMYDAIRHTKATNLVFLDANFWAADPSPFTSLSSTSGSYSMFATTNAVYAEHVYPCGGPDRSCTNDAAKASCATVKGIMNGFEVGDVRNHAVVVDEFGWPDASNGTEMQNVVSYLHGPNGRGRGFIAWELSSPTSTSSFRLRASRTVHTSDDRDATATGAPIKRALAGSYPSPSPCS